MSSSTLCSCELKPIVGSDCDESAHRSSNNWLSIQNPSTEEDDDDELMKRRRPGQDEVWKAIQAQKQQGDDHNNNKAPPIRSTVSWSAIILSDQKVDVQDSVPYIHPLLKKSSSCCLSKQSLQICTESLGSETGSDCLTSQTRDSDHVQDQVQDNKQAHEEEEEDIFNDVKIKNYSKKSASSFPPPLPSLANSSVQLRSHRQGKGEAEGSRLILEAVSVPQRNYFHAERSHGRLLLTALKSPTSSDQQEAGDDETDEDEEELESSTTPSFNSNSNHLYWNSSSIAEYKQQQQEKEEGLIPLLRNCKEARRRSLLTWVPPNYCIATSS
ncbi:PREDICTED: protein FAF-like, chloroplastic [Ipomoea nil]|uniref:protein FAF-like, chloroplastic n=1 Tax=Ipomoea nil TaxID=35883 RepID=UPI000901F0D1|nr:PREDICTED: protein FAF-like, chloroplastic [Ipomoea nil]